MKNLTDLDINDWIAIEIAHRNCWTTVTEGREILLEWAESAAYEDVSALHEAAADAMRLKDLMLDAIKE